MSSGVVAQGVGAVLAGMALGWARSELRWAWRTRRLPLTAGPLTGRVVAVLFASAAPLVAAAGAIFSGALFPTDQVGMLLGMVGWVIVAYIAGLVAAIIRAVRSGAAGWLILMGDRTVRLEAAGQVTELELRPGAVRAHFIDDQLAQFILSDGPRSIRFWGMPAWRDLGLVGPLQRVPPQGLMVASSMAPLCKWLRPFVAGVSAPVR